MLWPIATIFIAAFIVNIGWKLLKTILHVTIIAVVLAAGVALFGYHEIEIHLPKGIINHGRSVLTSLEHSASTAAHRVHRGLEKG